MRSVHYPDLSKRTNANGEFSFLGIPAVACSLDVRAEGYANVVLNEAARLAHTGPILVVLTRDASIAGRIVSPENEGLKDVQIAVGMPGRAGAVRCSTDREGKFALNGLTAGRHVLSISRRDLEARRIDAVATGGRLHDLGAIQLRPKLGVRVEGSITPPQSPLGHPWTVHVEHDGSRRTTHAVGGTYSVPGIRGKTAKVSVCYSGGDLAFLAAKQSISIHQVPDHSHRVDFTIDDRGAEVVGFVSAEGREYSERLSLRFRPLGLRSTLMRQSRLGQGSFRVRLPTHCSWTLDVLDASGECLASKFLGRIPLEGLDVGRIEVKPVGFLRFDSEVSLGSSVRILNEAGRPVRDVRQSDDSQSAKIALRPGSYLLERAQLGSWSSFRSFVIESGRVTVVKDDRPDESSKIVVTLSGNWPATGWIEILSASGRWAVEDPQARNTLELDLASGPWIVSYGVGSRVVGERSGEVVASDRVEIVLVAPELD